MALAHTVQTAGRTVLYSGATVAASLTALLVFPVPYLRSFAYAGVAVVAVACAASVVILPALLAWLGPRIGVTVQSGLTVIPRVPPGRLVSVQADHLAIRSRSLIGHEVTQVRSCQ